MKFEEQLITQLTRIADSLEKLSDDKGGVVNEQKSQNMVYTLEQRLEDVADELAPFEPALARLLQQYVK